jgi:hypothetical protein
MDIDAFETIIIEPEKISVYLLNIHHKDGSSKARFFISFGFTKNNCSDFLIQHLKSNESKKTIQTPFGIKYIIEGKLNTPTGVPIQIRSIWFVIKQEKILKFVTAYPL